MLSTITLPAKYRAESPILQLWLQSRVVPPRKSKRKDDSASKGVNGAKGAKGTGDEGKSMGDKAPIGETEGTKGEKGDKRGAGDKGDNGDKSADTFLAPCRVRPYTFANVRIALDLVLLLIPRCWAALWSSEHRDVRPLVATYAGTMFLESMLPALQLSASGQLLDLAERTLSTGDPASWLQAGSAAAAIVVLAVLYQRAKRAFKRAETRLIRYIKFKTEKEYLRIQLAERLPSNEDPLHVALLMEAGVHAGTNQARGPTGYDMRYSDIKYKLYELGSICSNVLAIIAQFSFTLYALRAGAGGSSMSTVSLMFLFTFPLLLQMWLSVNREEAWIRYTYDRDNQMLIHQLQRTADNREETVVMGMQDYVLQRWEKATLEDNQMKEDRAYEYESMHDRTSSITTAFQNFAWVLLATKAIKTTNSLANLTLLQGAIMGLSDRITQAASHVKSMMGQVIFFAAFIGMIDEQDRLLRKGGVDYETIRDPAGGIRIETRNLTVALTEAGKPAVDNVSITVEPGETLAVVGYNGSGKTTLVKTLLGLLRASSGDIALNGVSVAGIDMCTAYPRISVIFQEFFKYGLTLREEIAAGDIASLDDLAAIERAVERGRTQPVVDRVSLDTVVSPHPKEKVQRMLAKSDKVAAEEDDRPEARPWYERATFISGGEWQRVALARAFMAADRADLIVFDEPTAALDPRAEAELFETLLSLSKASKRRCTTIFISHQFGNVRRADKIAFMENGKIVEYGTHDELMARGGQYSELFALQGRGFQN